MRKYVKVILLLSCIILGLIVYRDYRRKAGIRYVESMASGINIGNTLDSTRIRHRKEGASVEYYESYWNNPLITRKLIAMIKEAGFATVRIPVSWDEHMDEEGKIDELWLDRVEEVVTYGIEEGLYVILDSHHESWLVPLPEMEEETQERLSVLWQQIAERFIDYPDQLLYEGMNEPRTIGSEGEWQGGTKEEREVVNRLNSTFVETVRHTGGNNSNRWLIVTTYGGNHSKEAIESLEIPEDNNIIVAVHPYIPYRFTQDEEGTSKWSKKNPEDREAIDELMEMLEEYYIKKDIPVIITEYGCIDKDNREDRLAWMKYYTESARSKKIGYVWWDNGKEYSIMDRENYSWRDPEFVKILTR